MRKLHTYRVTIPVRESFSGEVVAFTKAEALEKALEHIDAGDGDFTRIGTGPMGKGTAEVVDEGDDD